MIAKQSSSKGSVEKIPTFEVGDIVRIVPNHKPFSRSYITRKYPHSKQKENIGLVCFVEQVIGDRYSLYALEQPVRPCPEKCNHDLCKGIDELGNHINCQWYYGDILGSCLEHILNEFVQDKILHLSEDSVRNYKHFIYPDDMDRMINRMKSNEVVKA